MSKQEQSNVLKMLAEQPRLVSAEFEQLELSEKELHKRTMVEKIPFNLAHYMKTNEIVMEESLLIVYFYANQEGTTPFVLEKIG